MSHVETTSIQEVTEVDKHTRPAQAGRDTALEIIGEDAAPFDVTPEQNAIVLRKIDLWIMPVITLVYFLQQLDK